MCGNLGSLHSTGGVCGVRRAGGRALLGANSRVRGVLPATSRRLPQLACHCRATRKEEEYSSQRLRPPPPPPPPPPPFGSYYNRVEHDTYGNASTSGSNYGQKRNGYSSYDDYSPPDGNGVFFLSLGVLVFVLCAGEWISANPAILALPVGVMLYIAAPDQGTNFGALFRSQPRRRPPYSTAPPQDTPPPSYTPYRAATHHSSPLNAAAPPHTSERPHTPQVPEVTPTYPPPTPLQSQRPAPTPQTASTLFPAFPATPAAAIASFQTTAAFAQSKAAKVSTRAAEVTTQAAQATAQAAASATAAAISTAASAATSATAAVSPTSRATTKEPQSQFPYSSGNGSSGTSHATTVPTATAGTSHGDVSTAKASGSTPETATSGGMAGGVRGGRSTPVVTLDAGDSAAASGGAVHEISDRREHDAPHSHSKKVVSSPSSGVEGRALRQEDGDVLVFYDTAEGGRQRGGDGGAAGHPADSDAVHAPREGACVDDVGSGSAEAVVAEEVEVIEPRRFEEMQRQRRLQQRRYARQPARPLRDAWAGQRPRGPSSAPSRPRAVQHARRSSSAQREGSVVLGGGGVGAAVRHSARRRMTVAELAKTRGSTAPVMSPPGGLWGLVAGWRRKARLQDTVRAARRPVMNVVLRVFPFLRSWGGFI